MISFLVKLSSVPYAYVKMYDRNNKCVTMQMYRNNITEQIIKKKKHSLLAIQNIGLLFFYESVTWLQLNSLTSIIYKTFLIFKEKSQEAKQIAFLLIISSLSVCHKL